LLARVELCADVIVSVAAGQFCSASAARQQIIGGSALINKCRRRLPQNRGSNLSNQ